MAIIAFMNSSISASAFAALLKDAPFIIDVRRADEFAEFHVVSARHFPIEGLVPAAVAGARTSEAEAIYILCKSGMRAGKAAEKLRAAGVRNVCVVEGGTEACVKAGIPIAK